MRSKRRRFVGALSVLGLGAILAEASLALGGGACYSHKRRQSPQQDRVTQLAITYLVEQLRDENEYRRESAIVRLGEMGPEARDAVPPVLEVVKERYENDDYFDRYDWPGIPSEAVKALGKIGPPAMPNLVEALKYGNELVRLVVALALGEMGPDAKDAIPALVEALKNENRPPDYKMLAGDVPSVAAHSLAKIGPAAVPALIVLLRDKEERVRRSAARALGRIGPASKDAVPLLIQELKRGDSYYQRAIIEVLGEIGPEAKQAIPFLTELVKDLAVPTGNEVGDLENSRTRKVAEEALKKIRGQ